MRDREGETEIQRERKRERVSFIGGQRQIVVSLWTDCFVLMTLSVLYFLGCTEGSINTLCGGHSVR
jgi:hypothetical protein